MKIVKRLFIGIIAIIGILGVVSLFLPDQVHIERRTSIAAAPAAVFLLLNDYRNSKKWSPWLARDPQTKVEHSGADKGVGARMAWHSEHPEVGVGSQEITVSEQDRLIRMSLTFEGQGNATAYFELTPEGDGTSLVWGFDNDLGYNPVMRYMGLMFDTWLGPDFEKGLANIKGLVESG